MKAIYYLLCGLAALCLFTSCEQLPQLQAFSFQFHHEQAPTAKGRATIQLDKLNHVIKGVYNPITIVAQDYELDELNIIASMDGITLQRTPQGVNLQINAPIPKGKKFDLIVKTKEGDKEINRRTFIVDRLPDPIAKLTNNKTDGKVREGEMRVQRGIMAIFENMDISGGCKVEGYTMYYIPEPDKVITIKNQGGAFKGEALEAVQAAQPGMQYQFVNVMARCPGDAIPRKLNGLAFTIR